MKLFSLPFAAAAATTSMIYCSSVLVHTNVAGAVEIVKPDDILQNCITLEAGNWVESDRDEFCEAHESLNTTQGCCHGNGACNNWNLNATYTICKASCRGRYSCDGIGGGSSSLTSVDIGVDACKGRYSCSKIAYEFGETVTIGNGACVQSIIDCLPNYDDYGDSCRKVGYNKASYVYIGDGSCKNNEIHFTTDGHKACASVGEEEAEEIIIEPFNCLGDESCNTVGKYNATAVEILGISCVGQESCLEEDCSETTHLTIHNNACVA